VALMPAFMRHHAGYTETVGEKKKKQIVS
jgi:hypothetical protein